MKIISPLFLSIALLGSLLSVSPMGAQLSVARKSSPYKDLTVDSSTFKTFRDLQIAAESKAASYIKQAFSSNVSQIFLRVLGDRNGSISPILTISVSNAQWRSQPKIQTWAKYYPISNVLLGFVAPAPPAIAPPTAKATTPATPASPTNPVKIESSTVPRVSLPEVQNLPGFRDD